MPELEINGVTKRTYGFQPGQSGNPGGRPKGIAAIVRELTNDGRSLLEMVWQIATAPDTNNRERLEASKILLDRGFGRAPEISLTATVDAGQVDLSALASDQLESLVRTLAAPGPRHILSADAVDTAVDALLEPSIPAESQAFVPVDVVSKEHHIKVGESDALNQSVAGGGGDGGGHLPASDPGARGGDPSKKIPTKTLEAGSQNKNSAPKTLGFNRPQEGDKPAAPQVKQPKKSGKRKKAAPKAKAVKVNIKLKPPTPPALEPAAE